MYTFNPTTLTLLFYCTRTHTTHESTRRLHATTAFLHYGVRYKLQNDAKQKQTRRDNVHEVTRITLFVTKMTEPTE